MNTQDHAAPCAGGEWGERPLRVDDSAGACMAAARRSGRGPRVRFDGWRRRGAEPYLYFLLQGTVFTRLPGGQLRRAAAVATKAVAAKHDPLGCAAGLLTAASCRCSPPRPSVPLDEVTNGGGLGKERTRWASREEGEVVQGGGAGRYAGSGRPEGPAASGDAARRGGRRSRHRGLRPGKVDSTIVSAHLWHPVALGRPPARTADNSRIAGAAGAVRLQWRRGLLLQLSAPSLRWCRRW